MNSESLKIIEMPQVQPPAGVNADQALLALMAMSESFRGSKLPNYKMAIKCAMAALKVPSSPHFNALCIFELGKLLWHYTRNQNLALAYTTKSYERMRQLGEPLAQNRIRTLCLLSEILMSQRKYKEALTLISAELNAAQKFSEFYPKILLFYAESYLRVGDYNTSLSVVNSGIQYIKQQPKMIFAECYFRLAKSLILSIEMTRQQELGKSVGELGEILQSVQNDDLAINDIRAFCYTIQLCYFLSTGMVKNSKQCLRQLHMTVQSAEQVVTNINSSKQENPSNFIWLRTELLTGLAYVLTVLCNVQYSNLERAHRYYGTALKHLEGLRHLMRKSNWTVVRFRDEEFIDRMEMLLFEAIAQTQLIVANPQETLTRITNMTAAVRRSRHLLDDFSPQIHTLLGFYLSFVRLPYEAEKQFRSALQRSSDPELSTVIYLSLAIVYLFTGRENDFYDLFDYISPLKLKSQAISLRSIALYIQSLHFFIHMRIQECRAQLMECIAITKEEDMARLQSMAFLLLSKLYINDPEVVKASLEWAQKSCDAGLILSTENQSVQFHLEKGQVQEANQIALNVENKKTEVEHARHFALKSSLHQIIHWTGSETAGKSK